MNDKDQDIPSVITGGCLCGAIRYTVNFNQEYPWPPIMTCQCTMCRKWTSSLIAQFLVISPKQINPALNTFLSFKEYTSSPGRFRGFCGDCGTSIAWRSADYTPIFDLYLGTLDEKYLAGDGVVARTLATPNGTQYWLQNAVRGVTDVLEGGKKYSEEGPDGIRDAEESVTREDYGNIEGFYGTQTRREDLKSLPSSAPLPQSRGA
ncbi:hypothetical protein LB505_005930 [Fusarium chuoi]|nr:hypothetical protein LB505_005930 [Fusarium chuoi]